MSLTVSMSVGRIAILHDVRKEISANVDKSLIYRNDIFIDKLKDHDYDLKSYTNDKFQKYIDEYNTKQTRPERRKNMSYVEIIESENKKLLDKAEDNKKKGIKTSIRKPTQLAHEYVIQVGNRDTNSTLKADIEQNKQYCKAILNQIQDKYPHADILLATYHADEPNGTPHMHILVQFTGEGYKQGLKQQISISKALECDGFERSNNRGDYAINRWVEDVKDSIMTPKLKYFFQEDREIIGDKRPHEDIRFFRKKAREEAEALQEKIEEAEKDKNVYNYYNHKSEETEKEFKKLRNELNELRNEYGIAEIHKMQLDNKIKANSENLNEINNMINEKNSILHGLKDQISELEKNRREQEQLKKELDNITDKVSELQLRKSVLNGQYMELDNQIKQKKEELSEVNDLLNNALNRLKTANTELKDISYELDKKNSEYSEMEVNVKIKTEELNNLNSEIAAFSSQLVHAIRNVISKLFPRNYPTIEKMADSYDEFTKKSAMEAFDHNIDSALEVAEQLENPYADILKNEIANISEETKDVLFKRRSR